MASFPFTLTETVKKAEIYEINTLDEPPVSTKQVAPVYPQDMKSKGVQSNVVVVFIVDEDGSVQHPAIESMASPSFGEEAIKAVKQWEFEPGMKDGVPVKTLGRLPLSFSLRR